MSEHNPHLKTNENPYRSPTAELSRAGDSAVYGELNWYSAKGRIGRLRYLAWSGAIVLGVMPIFMFIGVVVGMALANSFSGEDISETFLNVTIAVIYAVVFFFYCQFAIQRLHDMNASGWWAIPAVLIPGATLLLIVMPGQVAPNRFGPPPPPNSMAVTLLAGVGVFFFIVLLVSIVYPLIDLFEFMDQV